MKITLLNTESGKKEEFEPVDAREVLGTPDTIYRTLDAAEPAVGLTLESSASADIDVPQLQASDSELQTGSSTQKYDREAVVKAEPGTPDTTSRSEQAVAATKPASEGLTVPQIKDALAAKNIEIPAGVTKRDDLAALLDKAA